MATLINLKTPYRVSEDEQYSSILCAVKPATNPFVTALQALTGIQYLTVWRFGNSYLKIPHTEIASFVLNPNQDVIAKLADENDEFVDLTK